MYVPKPGANNLVKNGDFHDFTLDVTKYSPVAYWMCSDGYHQAEGTGKTKWQDLSGNGHDLTPMGGIDQTLETEDSTIYKGVKHPNFDGINDYAYIPAAQATAFNPGTGDFSVVVSFKTGDDVTSWTPVITKGGLSSSYKSYGMYIYNGHLYFAVYDGTQKWFSLILKSGVLPNTKYDVVISVKRDGTITYNVNSTVNTYLASANSIDLTDSYNFEVGRYYATNGYFNGTIYHAAYFNRALTDQEVKEISGLAKGWTWDGVGSVQNNNFQQVVSDGGSISQILPTTKEEKYFINDGYISKIISKENYNLILPENTYTNVQALIAMESKIKIYRDLIKEINLYKDLIKEISWEEPLK